MEICQLGVATVFLSNPDLSLALLYGFNLRLNKHGLLPMIRVRAQSSTCLCLERSERNDKSYENLFMNFFCQIPSFRPHWQFCILCHTLYFIILSFSWGNIEIIFQRFSQKLSHETEIWYNFIIKVSTFTQDCVLAALSVHAPCTVQGCSRQ